MYTYVYIRRLRYEKYHFVIICIIQKNTSFVELLPKESKISIFWPFCWYFDPLLPILAQQGMFGKIGTGRKLIKWPGYNLKLKRNNWFTCILFGNNKVFHIQMKYVNTQANHTLIYPINIGGLVGTRGKSTGFWLF